MTDPTRRLLDEAERRGLISTELRGQLAILSQELAADAPQPADSAPGVTWVNAAYAVGAILVLFAFGWFLVKRWSSLGPAGVLLVTAAYGTSFVVAARWLERRSFPRAASLATVLTIGLTPLATWAVLSLVGEWPPMEGNDPLTQYRPYMTTRWLIVDLATILAGLLVLRRRRDAVLTLPVALAAWWTLFHGAQAFEDGWGSLGYQRWIMTGAGLVVIGIAEVVERWQRNERATRQLATGDFAGAFWLVGLLGFSVAYAAQWLRLDEWQHLLAPIAAGVIGLSLVLKRRVVFGFGLAGVIAYLAFLAEDVFKAGAAFPLVLAFLGVATIGATVWLQRRFPRLLAASSQGQEVRPLPWSRPMAWVPALFASAMALLSLPDLSDERLQREFRQRFQILREHSGSLRAQRSASARAREPGAQPDAGVAVPPKQ